MTPGGTDRGSVNDVGNDNIDDENRENESVVSGLSSSVASVSLSSSIPASLVGSGPTTTLVKGRKKRINATGTSGSATLRTRSEESGIIGGSSVAASAVGDDVKLNNLAASAPPSLGNNDSSGRGSRRGRERTSSGGGGGILAAGVERLRSVSRSLSRSRRGSGSSSSMSSSTNSATLNLRSATSDRDMSRRGSGSSRSQSKSRGAGMYTSLGQDRSSAAGDGVGNINDTDPSTSSSTTTDAYGDIIVTVTSCRSDAYHEGRAPGGPISKIPRRAPSALKTFQELAVGIKDAYEAGGFVPLRPPLSYTTKNGSGGGVPLSIGGSSSGVDGEGEDDENDNNSNNVNNNTTMQQHQPQLSDAEWHRHGILFEFMGNLDFLLALVDEVAIDTATRGALKEDTTFRGLRDVIKKCNKVLDMMLVRRERKYTLMFRIVSVDDAKALKKISHWNARVEKALGGVTQDYYGDDGSTAVSTWRRKVESGGDDGSEMGGSVSSSISTSSSLSSKAGAVLRRGREMLPTAGKVRARRATPTPRLRRRRSDNSSDNSVGVDSAGEDGYSSDTVPMTTENLTRLQLSLDSGSVGGGSVKSLSISELHGDKKKRSDSGIDEPSGLGLVQPMKPKDELLDVIRGLRSEQMRAREAIGNADIGGGRNGNNVLDEIKSNFIPKAEIPSAVPKLPIEYIHRHRLMKQVVNCLLDRNTGPRDTDDTTPFANTITCITSRHSDKAGNGKTTLAVAAIQTVEVREFFSDGIAWLHLGRTALGEREVRRMYEQLYDQLLGFEEDDNAGGKEDDDENSSTSSGSSDDKRHDNNVITNASPTKDFKSSSNISTSDNNKLTMSRRYFQGGELEGMKEDLSRLLISRRVLICLDDVCKMEDAKWFLFGTQSDGDNKFEDTPHRVLITTQIPGLVGPGITHEVFVRIFSEHEAVKLLLTAAGRRPNGLPKVSPVFAQARIIVKGCGNSPLALRIAGGMLRSRNRNWTLSSPAWKLLVEQCRTSLEEASRIRSFANSVQRLIDLSFATVTDNDFRSVLRECFVAFALVFHDTDSLKVGKGISRAVVIRLFAVVASIDDGHSPSLAQVKEEELADYLDYATLILDTLETMNLVQRAGHGLSKSSAMSRLDVNDINVTNITHSNHKCYSMHESIKAIATDMSKRNTSAFAPLYDDFNSFIEEADVVPESYGPPFPFDEFMVMMLTGQVAEMTELIQNSLYERWNIEEYVTENLPLHFLRAKMVKKASEVLINQDFCTRRVVALGPIEATRRHVSDLIELRRAHANLEKDMPSADLHLNIVDNIQEGSTCIINEVIRQSQDSPKSVNIAICLSTMGEGLIKARQPRDASQRLDEAATLYCELLGKVHIDVARAVNALAKSLVKINETRSALIRFGESSSTYEDCNASHHFDSIANLQGMANLFVTTGDFQAATALYENVISRKQSVHGEYSVATAKTINDCAVILAKNGRMEDALGRYEKARKTYERALAGLPPSMSWLNHGESAAKCGFDMALINLNIASIKSKKGDIAGAINAYNVGVQGLRKYKEDLELAGDDAGRNKNSSHMRHLVSALGRIGSLKLKQGDRNGALEIYVILFKEVDDKSPTVSRLEKAKAHIKCATIYRQSGEKEDNKHAINHLREALNMFIDLYGKNNKDTVAVATSLQQWEEEQNSRSEN